MPDLNLHLDPETERQLADVLDHRCVCQGFTPSGGAKLVLGDAEPRESSLIRTLKEKLPFVDFEAGGLKVYESNYRGSKLKFTVNPRWELDPHAKGGGAKSLGGPSLTLQFSYSF